MTTVLDDARQAVEMIEAVPFSGAVASESGPWKCEYTPQDAQFWVPDHLAIRSLAVAEDLETVRSNALLDIRLELNKVSREVLQNATLRIHIRDTFGMTQLIWRGAALDPLLLGDEGIWVLQASLRLEPEVLERLEVNGPNSLHLIREDHEGAIMDDAVGTLRVISG